MEDLAPEAERPERRPARPERPRERRRAPLRVVLGVLGVVAVFLIGLVVGRAIEDAPRPGGQQTVVRTLEPSTLAPVETVTVTVEAP